MERQTTELNRRGSRWILGLALGAALAAASCTRAETSSPTTKQEPARPPEAPQGPQPPQQQEQPAMKPTPVANPYQLADRAIAAYRGRDLGAWSQLVAKPPSADARPEQVFEHAGRLAPADKVKGLYIQRDTGRIAAVLKTVPDSPEALWFELVRAPEGGFLVERVVSGPKNPSLDYPVEG